MAQPAGSDVVRIVFLGGLGEIGRNCFCLEVENRILVVDCGIMFPDVDMPGIDLVLPDFTYLRDNADRVEGVILTHAHEDHAGGLAFLLRDVPCPIYGSPLASVWPATASKKRGCWKRTELIPVADGEQRMIGPFDVEFIPVTHSVPHAFAAAYHTPQGTILHTGDFKIDLTPVDGRRTDLARLGEIARRPSTRPDGKFGGVRLLLSDSTNAERPGFTPSESTVGQAMRTLFREREDKRFIVASFASHLHRVQQVAEAALANGRYLTFVGRSMANNVTLAREMGLLPLPSNRVIDIEESARYAPGDFPARPSDRNPVFYGSFDWHSCVEMHWLLVRLLRTADSLVPADLIRATLDRQFAADALLAEAAYVAGPSGAVRKRRPEFR
jgi:ribonuclease J